MGIIYFIKCDDMVKIGFTAKNLSKRYSAIRGMCAHPVELMGTIQGTQSDERSLHSKYREHQVHGEWFRLSPDWIDDIPKNGWSGHGNVAPKDGHRFHSVMLAKERKSWENKVHHLKCRVRDLEAQISRKRRFKKTHGWTWRERCGWLERNLDLPEEYTRRHYPDDDIGNWCSPCGWSRRKQADRVLATPRFQEARLVVMRNMEPSRAARSEPSEDERAALSLLAHL